MKKPTSLLSSAIHFIPAAAQAAAVTVTVIHKQTSIRKDKQFFSPAVAVASFKDKLDVLGQDADWYKVSYKGKTGWVHTSAVSGKPLEDESAEKKKGFSLFGKKKDPQEVSQDDVALAGKGFNEQVEGEYKKKNPNLDFKTVDEMEKINVDEKTLAGFVKSGKLEARDYEDKT